MEASRRTARILLVPLGLAALGAAAPSTCFAPPRTLSAEGSDTDLSFNFKESVATLADGSVHAVWHERADGTYRVFYRRSPDRGEHWEPARSLSKPGFTAGHPAIAASAGHVYVAWHQQGEGGLSIVLRRSADAGRHFGPPRALESSGTASHVSLAADGSHVQALWVDSRSGFAEVFARSSVDGGAVFSDVKQLSEPLSASWVPNVDVHGDVAVAAWVDYRDANEEEYVRVSRDRGATWEPAVRVTWDAADSWAPSVAVRGETIFLAWFDRRAAGLLDGDVEAALDGALALLGLPVEPAPPRDPSIYYLPSFRARLAAKQQALADAAPGWLAAGGDAEALDALLQTFEARFDAWERGFGVFLARSPDLGRTWEPPRLVSRPGRPALRPSLAVSLPYLHLAWFEGPHGEDEIEYRVSWDAGDALGPAQRITAAAGASRRPSLSADGRDVHVLWVDDREGGGRIAYRRGTLRPAPSAE